MSAGDIVNEPIPTSPLPATMPAAVYVGDGALEVHDIPVPELHDEGALVEVSHCGICGTDLHFVLERMGRHGAVFGHEWSGTVVALGSAASTTVPPGTHVVVADRAGCGTCRACRAGRPSVCLDRATPNFFGGTGAFTRYMHVDAARLLPLPAGLSLRSAALTEPVAIAMHALSLSGVGPDDRVLVTGAGPVGLLMVAVLKAAGIDDITVSEPAPARRERAAALGAATVEPGSLPPAPMGRPVGEPFTYVFECSGRAAAAEAALDGLRAAAHQPQPGDHSRAHPARFLQLRRARLRGGARAPGLRAAAARPAHRTRRRAARRRRCHHGAARSG
jgi:(R,R)-butanediol dehydrogenase/meso-butanediol dehydrogenase/diacetyl reductase